MDQALPKTYDALAKSYLDLQQQLVYLQEQLRLLQRQRFAAKSESLLHPGMQPLFDLPNPEPEEKPKKESTVKEHTRSARKPLPDCLPREDVHLELSEEEQKCPCCSEPMVKISEKCSEKLHKVPANVVVKRFITPIYSCKSCETVKQAKMPYHPISKCSVTIETLADIMVSKFIDGLPFHRQEKIFARHGVDIGRDKMARWAVKLSKLTAPLVGLLNQDLIESGRMSMDETTLQVLKEKGRRPDQKSYMIVQAREGPPGKNITIFNYEKSRAAYVIQKYLKGFKGSMITDGLATYQSCLSVMQGISHGGCMAHARRKLMDTVKAKKGRSDVAKKAIEIVKALFSIENRLKGKDEDEILKVRQAESKPLMDELKNLWVSNIESVPKKSLTGGALHYLKNQWTLLSRFLNDPKLPMHNNYLERQIRPFAMGRRAWLFADTQDGAHASAIFYSLLNTAKENGINPTEYMVRVLSEIGTTDDLKTLLPFS